MQMKSNRLFRFLVLPVLLFSLAVPAHAQSISQPQTREELISYLYGQVMILKEILALRLAEENSNATMQSSSRTSSRDAEIDIDTLSARNVEEDEADLQLRVDFDDTQRATVWFEYGEDKDDFDERTSKYSLTKTGDDGDTIRISVRGLDEDEKYYYQAVGEDNEGNRTYGSIRSFTTEEDDDDDDGDGDFDISVDDRTIDEGDEIRVDWEVPDDDASSQNWIGLFEYGDGNYDYVEWTYIDDDDSGRVYFTIDDEGDYDVRLFLNNTYDDEVRSGRIEVDD